MNEVPDGKVVSFTIGDRGEVNLVANISSGGNGPPHVLPLKHTKEVAVVNVSTIGLKY